MNPAGMFSWKTETTTKIYNNDEKPELNELITFAVNISTYNNILKIIAEVPGVDKKDISLLLENGILTIEVVKIPEKEIEKRVYIRNEIYTGILERSFEVGPVSIRDIGAEYSNGILTIIIHNYQTSSQKIEIK